MNMVDVVKKRREFLEKHLSKEALAEFDFFEKAIQLFEEPNKKTDSNHSNDVVLKESLRSQIVAIAIELIIKNNNKGVTNQQIIDYATQKGVDWGSNKPKDAVASSLYQEVKKNSGQLRKIRWGVWGIKTKKASISDAHSNN